MYQDNQEFNQAKNAFFSILKIQNQKCLAPGQVCRQKVRDCHSVQMKRVLVELAENSHLICIREDTSLLREANLDNDRYLDVMYDRISIDKATTFTGLCSVHDQTIFRPIDTEPIDLFNDEHCFLLSYRAVLKRLTLHYRLAKVLQSSYLKKSKIAGLSEDELGPDAVAPVLQALSAAQFELYKKQFDHIYLEKKYSDIYSRSLILDCNPTFAACDVTVFGTKGNSPLYLSFNIFPFDGKMQVLFSCLIDDKDALDQFLEALFRSTIDEQKYWISTFALKCCEDIVFSPSYFSTWSQAKKDQILHLFWRKMKQISLSYDNALFNIFD